MRKKLQKPDTKSRDFIVGDDSDEEADSTKNAKM